MTEHVCVLGAVGDIMPYGKIANRMAETGDPAFPFRKIKALLEGHSVLFGNFETMITNSRVPSSGSPTKYFSPVGTAQVLAQVGFKILNLGHNHAYDWGEEGVLATMKEMDEAGIAYAGLGRNFEEAGRPAVIKCNCGRNFGFLCYTGTYNTLNKKHAFVGRPPSDENLKSDILNLKSKVDVLVVSIHGGACLNYWPSPDMLHWCRSAAECGADVVLGHHPHVIQGIEIRDGRLIAYGLPDFIRPFPFDEDEVHESMKAPKHESMLLRIHFKNGLYDSHKIFPCIIDDELQTRTADSIEEKLILERVEKLSNDITLGQSTRKHFDVARRGFFQIYIVTLLRAFRRGGFVWLWQRIKTLRPYHWRILFKAIVR